MGKIAPKDRFNKHENVASLPRDLVAGAIRKFGWEPERCAVVTLSGGFMNTNLLVTRGAESRVFRFYSRDFATAERENDLLQFLKDTPVPCPRAHALFEAEGRPVCVLDYVDGMTLEDRLLDGEPIDLEFYRTLGRKLAQIHQIQFEDAGFIGRGATPGREFENFGEFLLGFIRKTLDWLETREERLDRETATRFRKLVNERWRLVNESGPRRQLVHADFNPKNILVSRVGSPRILAVIDWEFSLSADGLADLGNLFRFSYDYAAEAREHFAAGYREVDPSLQENWPEVARLLDLANMCAFLERPENYEKSFRTARAVIRGTLEHFSY